MWIHLYNDEARTQFVRVLHSYLGGFCSVRCVRTPDLYSSASICYLSEATEDASEITCILATHVKCIYKSVYTTRVTTGLVL